MMKRLGLAVAGGVWIPILYFWLLFTLSGVAAFLGTGISGETFDCLSIPVTWAGDLYNYLFPAKFEIPYGHLRREVFFTDIIADFLFYALLTYLFVRARAKNKLL